MSDDSVQNYGNHTRWFPPWHFLAIPILVINMIVMLVALIRAPSLDTAWGFIVALALALGLMLARYMTLRVQDRVIRLEEELRLNRLLPGRYTDIESLSLGQLIALRFASDAEVGHILDRILSGEIQSRRDIKIAVQHWRPDHLRA